MININRISGYYDALRYQNVINLLLKEYRNAFSVKNILVQSGFYNFTNIFLDLLDSISLNVLYCISYN